MISIIVAKSKNNVIGSNGSIPWNIPKDLKYFKELTEGNTVIMGRKTYESIGRPLPNRINYVVSRTFKEISGTYVFSSLEEAISNAEKENIQKNIENEIVIIGGGHIFQETAQTINKLIITRVDCDIDGDIYYPKLNLQEWKLVKTESYKRDFENDYDFKIEEYVRL